MLEYYRELAEAIQLEKENYLDSHPCCNRCKRTKMAKVVRFTLGGLSGLIMQHHNEFLIREWHRHPAYQPINPDATPDNEKYIQSWIQFMDRRFHDLEYKHLVESLCYSCDERLLEEQARSLTKDGEFSGSIEKIAEFRTLYKQALAEYNEPITRVKEGLYPSLLERKMYPLPRLEIKDAPPSDIQII